MTLTMRAEVRDELVKRLRSGDYIQGKEKLALKDGDGERYCCLGVLCEIAVEEGVIHREEHEEEHWDFDTDDEGIYVEQVVVNYMDAGSYDATLPPKVAIWAGLLTEEEWAEMSGAAFDDGAGMGRFAEKVAGQPTMGTLAGMNDDGVPFSEIADFIEKNVRVVE